MTAQNDRSPTWWLQRFDSNRFLSGILSGISSTATVYETRPYGYGHASATDALRGDWARVGRDFRRVIDRANDAERREPAKAR